MHTEQPNEPGCEIQRVPIKGNEGGSGNWLGNWDSSSKAIPRKERERRRRRNITMERIKLPPVGSRAVPSCSFSFYFAHKWLELKGGENNEEATFSSPITMSGGKA